MSEISFAAQGEGGAVLALKPNRMAMAILPEGVLYGRITGVGGRNVWLTRWVACGFSLRETTTRVPRHLVIAYAEAPS